MQLKCNKIYVEKFSQFDYAAMKINFRLTYVYGDC